MIQRDDAYKFLKNVRVSPQLTSRGVQYEVLAMIRQLGIPTFFFALSAVDMQWQDVIQSIARHYGIAYTTRRSVEHCTPQADGAWLNELGWSQ